MSSEMYEDDLAFIASTRRRRARGDRPVTVVDLFSGCGGLTIGVEEAARQVGRPIDVRLACEIDSQASNAYVANFPSALGRTRGNVLECFDRKVGMRSSSAEAALRKRVGAVDFLVGGPPCQGHSTLNNHTRGDDPKNALYLSMVRAAEVLSPQVVIIENVPAVERDANGVVSNARDALARLGYFVATKIVSMVDIGVPQLRRRHVLLATTATLDIDSMLADSGTSHRSVRWAIDDLVQRRTSALDEPAVMTPENRRRAEYLLRRDLYDLPNSRRPVCHRDAHKYKSMYGRLRWDEPAQTITTGFSSPGQGRYLHPSQPRTLTAHEAARLQFFPDWFDFSAIPHRRALARAIGNAVPPKLAFVVGRAALSILKAGNAVVAARARQSASQELPVSVV